MTPLEYRNRVVNLIISCTGWTAVQAINTVGDLSEMQEDGLTPHEAATEILLAAAEDS